MNTNSHTADALREILATCADPLNRACEEYAKLERELAEAQDIAAELITERARRSFEDRMSAASETRRTYEDGLEEAKNAVKRVTSAGRWDCGYEEPFDDAVQLCMSAIRAIKKSDPQGSDTNLETTASRVAPAASAPCVAPAPIPTEDVLWEIRQELAALVSDPNNPDWMPALKNGNPADAECLNRAYELTGRGSESSAPCVARRAVEEIKAIIQKHVPLPGWAYEDEIVRVVRECERPEQHKGE